MSDNDDQIPATATSELPELPTSRPPAPGRTNRTAVWAMLGTLAALVAAVALWARAGDDQQAAWSGDQQSTGSLAPGGTAAVQIPPVDVQTLPPETFTPAPAAPATAAPAPPPASAEPAPPPPAAEIPPTAQVPQTTAAPAAAAAGGVGGASTTGGSATAAQTASTVAGTAAPAPATTEKRGRDLFGGNSAEDKLMPNVICMSLQEAQNEIQDHGVFFSKSKDASGKNRRQIIDANWIVVDQKPAAGTKIGNNDATLFVVKKGEEYTCP